MLSDEQIPEEGVGRKFTTAVQRSLIEYWAKMHQTYRATGDCRYKLPARCWIKLQAVREKSYVPIVPEGLGVFTGEQQLSVDELENVASNRYAVEWNFKKKRNYIRQLEGTIFEELHDASLFQGARGGGVISVIFHHIADIFQPRRKSASARIACGGMGERSADSTDQSSMLVGA